MSRSSNDPGDELAELCGPVHRRTRGRREVRIGSLYHGEHLCLRRERDLCAVIANNLDDGSLRATFSNFIELGEWAILEACERAERKEGMRQRRCSREVLHHNIVLSHSGSVHPLLFLCHEVRQSLSLGLRRAMVLLLSARALLEKIRKGTNGTIDLLLLMAALRYREAISCRRVRGGSSGMGHRLPTGTDGGPRFYPFERSHDSNAGVEAKAAVIDLLEHSMSKRTSFSRRSGSIPDRPSADLRSESVPMMRPKSFA